MIEPTGEDTMRTKDLCVYRTEKGLWSFYDENNRPVGIFYESIEQAIDALYRRFQFA
jgi:hypothetical protein